MKSLMVLQLPAVMLAGAALGAIGFGLMASPDDVFRDGFISGYDEGYEIGIMEACIVPIPNAEYQELDTTERF